MANSWCRRINTSDAFDIRLGNIGNDTFEAGTTQNDPALTNRNLPPFQLHWSAMSR
jgi:hypothetical protein